jgi:hypothetical protein
LPKETGKGTVEQATRKNRTDHGTFINRGDLKGNKGITKCPRVSDLASKQRDIPRSIIITSKKDKPISEAEPNRSQATAS